jgi:hypothetical protein
MTVYTQEMIDALKAKNVSLYSVAWIKAHHGNGHLPLDQAIVEQMMLLDTITCTELGMQDRLIARKHLVDRGVIGEKDYPITLLEYCIANGIDQSFPVGTHGLVTKADTYEESKRGVSKPVLLLLFSRRETLVQIFGEIVRRSIGKNLAGYRAAEWLVFKNGRTAYFAMDISPWEDCDWLRSATVTSAGITYVHFVI